MKNINPHEFIKVILVGWVIGAIVSLSVGVAAICVIWHFVSKLW